MSKCGFLIVDGVEDDHDSTGGGIDGISEDEWH